MGPSLGCDGPFALALSTNSATLLVPFGFMAQGIQFLLIASGFALVGLLFPAVPIRILAVWFALCFCWVAIGYFGVGSCIFGKRKDGTLSPVAAALLAPYSLSGFGIVAACRWALREPPFQQVSGRLYFGRRLLGRERHLLEQLQVTAVLDLTAATPEPLAIRAGRQYRSVPLLDATAPSIDTLREVVGWMVQQSEIGTVYVHCAAGHGRVGLVAGAYLLATGEAADADESIGKLQAVRPFVRLSHEQRRRLAEFAAALPADSTG